MRSNISAAFDHALSSMPSPLSALGVDPPDWSSAAMNPRPAALLAVISAVFMLAPTMKSLAALLARRLPFGDRRRSAAERLDPRQFLPFHPFEEGAAGGRDECHFARHPSLVERRDGVAAARHRNQGSVARERRRRACQRLRRGVERRVR